MEKMEKISVRRPADIKFLPQDVYLIQFQVSNGKLIIADSFEIVQECLPPQLSEPTHLLFAISAIKVAFGDINIVSYALALPNECNCYLIGCYHYLDEAEKLVHEVQGLDYDTGCHWEARPI
jgi:hypothetical protein